MTWGLRQVTHGVGHRLIRAGADQCLSQLCTFANDCGGGLTGALRRNGVINIANCGHPRDEALTRQRLDQCLDLFLPPLRQGCDKPIGVV